MRARRTVLGASLVGVLAAGLLLAPSAQGWFLHPRDEAAFSDFALTHVGGWSSSADPGGPQRDESWVRDHPAAVVVEGDRACRWLGEQPDAPSVDPTRAHSVEALADRYLTHPGRTELPLSDAGSRALVTGAWQYLCWSQRRDKTAPAHHRTD